MRSAGGRYFSFVVIASCCLPAGCESNPDATETFKLAHSLSTDHPVHKAIEFMGERLAKVSAGTMRVEVYPNGQLGGERELIELLQIGSVSMTKVSTISMEGFSSEQRAVRRLRRWSDVDSAIATAAFDVVRGTNCRAFAGDIHSVD